MVAEHLSPPMTILVVDDSASNLLVMTKLVGKMPGCTAVTFASAVEALSWCDHHQPDMVVVDYMMPELDGLAFVERFRGLAHCADVPLMMVTVADLREVRHRALEAGVNDFLGRPVDATEFLMRSRNMLRLRQSQRQIAAQLEELTRSNEELARFAHVMAHELQPPLRIVSNYLQLLQRRLEGRQEGETDVFITKAFDGAKRMLGLVSSLVDYARVGTETEPLILVPCRPAADAAIAGLADAIAGTRATIDIGPLPLVMGEPGLLAKLFQSLLSNAIKFHAEGVAPRVRLGAERRGEQWWFHLTDNGIGVVPEDVERIFTLSERGLARDRYEGDGLGLALAKKIVERLGGSIWVDSRPGEGSTFWFVLPVATGERAAQP